MVRRGNDDSHVQDGHPYPLDTLLLLPVLPCGCTSGEPLLARDQPNTAINTNSFAAC